MTLYNSLEAETGQSCGVFQPGSLYLAQTQEREHQLRLQAAKAKLYGMNFHEVSRAEAESLHPLVNFDGIRCIMWEPGWGQCRSLWRHGSLCRRRAPEWGGDPPLHACNRYGAASRWHMDRAHTQGRYCHALGRERRGLWGREVAALAGIEMPLQPTEHQYFVTETIADIAAMDRRLPSVADRDGEYYLRQEGQGLLIGAYEKTCGSGPKTARRLISPMISSRTISNGSKRT